MENECVVIIGAVIFFSADAAMIFKLSPTSELFTNSNP